MASDFSEETATAAVVDSFSRTPDVRLREIMTVFTRHLHAFIREVQPTQGEWEAGIQFLTDVGHMSDHRRQEFILLSDVMGVSMLVDAINNRKPMGATESTVLGPFHVIRSPVRDLGGDIATVHDGPRVLVRGQVLNLAGVPIANAQVDVWQADDDGFYDIQKPDTPDQDLRGLFTADDDGRYWFTTILPSHYPIPSDGPVGKLLDSTGRHPYRPAHIHLITGATGYTPVTTHLFLEGSPYLEDDTVFGVKRSLIRGVTHVDNEEEASRYGLPAPFDVLEFDITLSVPETASSAP